MNMPSQTITQHYKRIGLRIGLTTCLIALPVLTVLAGSQQSTLSSKIYGTAPSSETTLSLFKTDNSLLLQQDMLTVNEQSISNLKFGLGYDQLAFSQNFVDVDGDELDVSQFPSLAKDAPNLIWKWYHQDGAPFDANDMAQPLSFYRGEKLKLSAESLLSFQTRTGLPRKTDLVIKSPLYTLEIVNPNPARLNVNGAYFLLDSSLPSDGFPSNGFAGAFFIIETPYSARQYDWAITSDKPIDTDFFQLDPLSGRVTFQKPPSDVATITITATAKPDTEAENYSDISFTHHFTLTRWWQEGSNFSTLTEAQAYCTNILGNNFVLAPNYRYLTDAIDDGSGNGTTIRDGQSVNSQALWNQWGDLSAYYWSSHNLRTAEQFSGIEYYSVRSNNGSLFLVNSDSTSLSTACVRNIDGTPIYNNDSPQIKNLIIEGTYAISSALTAHYTFEADSSDTDSSAYVWARSETAKAVVNSQEIIAVSGEVPKYYLRAEDIGRVIELSVEARNSRGNRGNILTVSTEMTEAEGNLTVHPEGIVAGGMVFPLNSDYPQTGFKGAWFKVQTPQGAQMYDWTITGAKDNYSLEPTTGIVHFLSEPTANQTVIIKAVGKIGTAVTGETVSHSFTPRYWFVTKNEHVKGYFILDSKYDLNDINSSPELWCSANLSGYRVPSSVEVTTASVNGYPAVTALGTDALGLNGRDTNGRLFNEWGHLSFYYPDADFAPSGANLVLSELTADERNAVSSNVGAQYLINKGAGTLYPLCVKDLLAPPASDVPSITHLTLEGDFTTDSKLTASYTFSANGGDGVTDRSRFAWGYRGKTVSYPNSDLAQLITTGNNIILSGDIPTNGASGFELPALNTNYINRMLELSVLPVNSDNTTGAVVTIDTAMSNLRGNLVKFPTGFVVNGITFPEDANFPQTAFTQAFFRMQLAEGVQNYTWTLENAGDAVTVDQATAEVRFVKPILDRRTVTLRAIGKTGTAGEGKQASHSFSINQWIEGSGDTAIRGFIPGDTGYDVSEPTSSPELWCAANYAGSRIISRSEFSNALPGGSPTGNLGADAEGYWGRGASGTLWNEWGYLNLSHYPNSNLGQGYYAEGYWLETLQGLSQRLSGDSNYGTQSYLERDYESAYQPRYSLCVLNPAPLNQQPTITNLTLSGNLNVGEALTASYTFAANGGDGVSDKSTYSWGYRGNTVTNVGTEHESLVTSGNIIEYHSVPDNASVGFTLPVLTLGHVNQVLELSVQPKNSINTKGAVVTIDTAMSNLRGNLVKFPTGFVVNGITFPEDANFPQTAFTQAFFRMQLAEGVQNYTWTLENAGDAVTVDQATAEVRFVKPILDRRTVTLRAIGKTGTAGEGKQASHSFSINQWIEGSGDTAIRGFIPGDTGYDVGEPTSSPELWCAANYTGSRIISRSEFSNALPGGSPTGNLGADAEGYWGRGASGTLWNEWGYLNLSHYPNSNLGQGYYAEGYWLETLQGLSQRLSGDSNYGTQSYLERDYESAYQPRYSLCVLNPAPLNQQPTITNLTLSGNLNVGEALTASYTFAANGGDGVSDKSTYSWGYRGNTVTNVGSENESLVTSGSNIIEYQAVPANAAAGFTLPKLTVAHVNQVLELSIQPRNSDNTAGKVMTVDSLMSNIAGNQINFPAGFVVNGMTFPENADFPQTAFTQAFFRMQSAEGVQNYTWSLENADDLVTIDPNTAEVRFVKPLLDGRTITVRGQGKTGTVGEGKQISHSFTVKSWWEPQVNPGVIWSEANDFCASYQSGFGLIESKYANSSPLILSYPPSTIYGIDANGRYGREPSGALWQEWGALTLYPQTNWVATPGYWATDVHVGLGEGYHRAFAADGWLGAWSQTGSIVCVKKTVDEQQPTQPTIKNLTLSGNLTVGEQLTASYTFAANGGDGVSDKSTYSWGYRGKTTTNLGNDNEALLTTGDGLLESGSVPFDAAKGFVLPGLTITDVNQVLELAIQPVNSDNTKGKIVAVDTVMSNLQGNQVILPAGFVVNGITFPASANFPQTAFTQAFFRIQLAEGAQNYTWTLENAGDAVTVDQATAEVRFVKPILDHRTVTIRATGKTGTITAGKQTSHSFSINQWIEGSGDQIVQGYLPSDAHYDPNDPTSSPELWCAANYSGSKVLPQLLFSNSLPFNGVPSSPFGLDAYGRNGRDANGLLWNEWGTLFTFHYPNSTLTNASSGLFWLDQFYDDMRLIGGASEGYTYYANPDWHNVGYTLCQLNPPEENQRPVITDLVLSGNLAEGEQLSASYTFTANGGDGVTDRSVYTWGELDKTVIAKGTEHEGLQYSVIGHQAVPTNGAAGFALPSLTTAHINQVLELSIQPVNSANIHGKIVTIDTSMSSNQGNHVVLPAGFVVNGVTFPQNANFPQTGFTHAKFRMQLTEGAQNYDWTLENADNAVTIDQKTAQVQLVKPILDGKTVTIRAQGKTGTTAEGKQSSHSFTIKHWIEGSGAEYPEGYAPGDSEYNINRPESSAELWCAAHYTGSKVVPSALFSQNIGAVYDVGRTANGLFWHEWGDVLDYPETSFTDELHGWSPTFWLNETQQYERLSAYSAGGYQEYVYKYYPWYQALCLLNPAPVTEQPTITHLTLSGNLNAGEALTASYTFAANGGDGVSDHSTYSWGYRGKTTTNLGNDNEALLTTSYEVLETGNVPADAAKGFVLPVLTADDVNQILELAIQPANSDNTKGKIVTVDTVMSNLQGNQVILPAGFVVNGITFPASANFPQTAFTQAFFRIQLAEGAQNYTWTLENAGDAVTVDQATAEVRFVKPILDHRTVTIRAIGKTGTAGEGKQASHSFNINQWIEGSGNQIIRGFIAGDTGYDAADPTSSPELWCETNYPGSRVISSTIYTNSIWALRDANGTLWDEWGDLSLSGYPASNLSLREYDAPYYWLNWPLKDANGMDSRVVRNGVNNLIGDFNRDYYSEENAVYALCVLNPAPVNQQPVITNLTLSGNLNVGEALTASYTFAANGGDNTTDKSMYSWGYRGYTVRNPGTEYENLTTDYQNTIESGPLPNHAAAGFTLPRLTTQHVNQVLELSIQPRNSVNTTGKVVTVNTAMSNLQGNQVVLPAGFVVNGITFPASANFPQTAFKQAFFRMQLAEGAQNYTWSLENAGDAVTIDQDTAEVRFVKPILDHRTVTLRATGKTGTAGESKQASHSFSINQWIEGSGDQFVRGFTAGDPVYDAADPNTSPELWCTANYPGSQVIPNNVFSNASLDSAPPASSLGYDANGLNGRDANGSFWNEWGYLTTTYYPQSSLHSDLYYGDYWLDKVLDSDAYNYWRLTGSYESGANQYTARFEDAQRYSTLCVLNPAPVNQQPTITHLTLSGNLNVGEALTASYTFAANGGDGVSDHSLFSFGYQGTTVTNRGNEHEALATSGEGVLRSMAVPANAGAGFTLPSMSLKDVNQILELSIQPQNSAGKKGEIQTTTTTMKHEDGNHVVLKPGYVVNGITFPMGADFPETGFTHAFFRMQLDYGAQNYDWSVDNAQNAVVVDGLTGNIQLIEPILDGREVTIHAVGKTGTVAENTAFSHPFRLKYWVESAFEQTLGYVKGDSGYYEGYPYYSPETWCANQYPNSTVLTSALFSNAENGFPPTNNIDDADGNQNAGRIPNGRLWNEWGRLSRISYPESTMPANESRQIFFWLDDLVVPDARKTGYLNEGKESASSRGQTEAYPLCWVNPPVKNLKPTISDLTLTGNIALDGFLMAKYTFTANGGDGVTDNSEYSWGYRGKTVSNTGSNNTNQLNLTGDGILQTGVARFDVGEAGVELRLHPEDINQILELSILPKNSDNQPGDIVTIDTSMSSQEGNQVILPSGLLVNGARFAKDADFPHTAFTGAEFRIELEEGIQNYLLTIENNADDAIWLDHMTGNVSFRQPIIDGRTVTLHATGKKGTLAEGKEFVHSFKIKTWVESTGELVSYPFTSSDPGYDENDPSTSPDLACKQLFPNSTVLNTVDYTNAPLGGYPDSGMVDEFGYTGREPNGRLSNEWGFIGNPYFLNATIAQREYWLNDTYPLDEIERRTLTDGWQSIMAFPRIYVQDSVLCNLVPDPTNRPFGLEELQLTGTLALGKQLVASYKLITNETDYLDTSKYVFGPLNTTVVNDPNKRLILEDEIIPGVLPDMLYFGAVNQKPHAGMSQIKLPTLSSLQLGTIMELSIAPEIQEKGLSGPIQTIKTSTLIDNQSSNPIITQLSLSGKPFFNNLYVNYQFFDDSALSNGLNNDRSEYAFGPIGTTVLEKGTVYERLNTSAYRYGVVPHWGGFAIPLNDESDQFVGGLFEVSLQPRNGDQVTGNIVTVNNQPDNPNNLTQMGTIFVNNVEFPLGSSFPQNAYLGAEFTIWGRLPADQYDWSIEGAGEEITLSEDGKVTFVKRLDQARTVTLTAVGKPGTEVSNETLKHTFTVSRWWDFSADYHNWDLASQEDCRSFSERSILASQSLTVDPYYTTPLFSTDRRMPNGRLWNEWGMPGSTEGGFWLSDVVNRNLPQYYRTFDNGGISAEYFTNSKRALCVTDLNG